jgi:hypothetical protein
MKFISKVLFSLLIAPIIRYRFKKLEQSYVHCSEAQAGILRQIINNLALTTFGREHNLSLDSTYEDFKNNISLNNYQDLEKYILEERQNRPNRLLNPAAKKWETTSGSSSSKKFIPYNSLALRDFRDMIIYWIADIITSNENIKPNKIFFSLSAHLTKENQSDIEDDSEYLPWYFRIFFKDFILMPRNIQKIKDNHTFNIYLCAYLLADKDLDTLFIWSPTYFLTLIDFIKKNESEILKLIKSKTLTHENKKYHLKVKNQRTTPEIEQIIKNNNWSHINYISCWTEGSAKYFLDDLKTYFPNAKIQGKGLLATEAPLTFPSYKAQGYLPLVNNIFYEFITENNEVKLIHELELGKKYELVITNRSGLIRYKMHDILEVTNFYHKTPCLKFIERSENSSDLTGEKLTSYLVQEAMDNIQVGLKAFLLPIIASPSYYVFISQDSIAEENIDQLLQNNYHFKQSRKLNQLAKTKTIIVKDLVSTYNKIRQSQGMKLGDIKFQNLITKPLKEKDFNEIISP